MLTRIDIRKPTSLTMIVVMLVTLAAPLGAARAGTPADDLKQIEYKYYFRGKYQQTIESLRVYLARVDVGEPEVTHAREFLAASYVLGGAPAMGKEVFMQIVTANPSYPGPDPNVFKLDVVNVYAEARAEYAALALKTAPATPTEPGAGSTATNSEGRKKPIYKQWWLYAGAAAVAVAVGVAAGGGDGGTTDRGPTGSVVVGVTVK